MRLRLYFQRTEWGDRLRLAALVLFPLWVASLPLFQFVLIPYALGFLLPLTLLGVLRPRPKLRAALPLVLLASSLASLYPFESPQAIRWCCAWLWFCLAFAAGHEFWTITDPVAEEQRQLAKQIKGLNLRMEDTLQQLRQVLADNTAEEREE